MSTLISLSGASVAGAGSSLSVAAGRSTVTLDVVATAGVTAGEVVLEGSPDDSTWTTLLTVELHSGTTSYAASGTRSGAFDLRAKITEAVVGGQITAVVGAVGATSTPRGHAAHYIGTWDVAVAYAAGECVRQWDGAEFKLYQAEKATTGDDPTSAVAPWAEVTTPIVMWGSEDPNATDSANLNGPAVISNGGIVAPFGSVYMCIGDSDLGFPPSLLWNPNGGRWTPESDISIDTDVNGVSVNNRQDASRTGAGSGNVNAPADATRTGSGVGDTDASSYSSRLSDGDGTAYADNWSTRGGSGTGDAEALSIAEVDNTAVGEARSGSQAVHHAGGEAHVISRATATGAVNDVKADLVFTDNTEGPVIHDQSDGHTYRIVSTAGVLSTVLVT